MKKRFPWFEILLAIVFLSIQVYAATSEGYNLANYWFIRDDAYYYYKVAQNISEGHGSTFDNVHLTNGYHPLWLVICIPIFALARFNIILPLRVLLIVMSLFSLFTAILLYRMIGTALSPPLGMLAALYWSFDYFMQSTYYQAGLESGVALLCTVGLVFMLYRFEKTWRQDRPNLTKIAEFGVLAVLVTFSRLDSIFFCAVIGIWLVFRGSPIRYLLPLDVLIITLSAPLAFISRLGIAGYYDSASAALIMIIAGLIIKIPTFYLVGLYQPPSSWNFRRILRNTFLAAGAGSALLAVITLAGNAVHLFPVFSRIILLIDGGLTFTFLLLSRLLVFAFKDPARRAQSKSVLNDLKVHWRDWLKEGSLFYGLLGGFLALYMFWNKLVFGTFTPVSGQIKRWWASPSVGALGGGAKSISSFLMLDPSSDYNAWRPVTSYLNEWLNALFSQDALNKFNWEQIFLAALGILILLLGALLWSRRRRSIRYLVRAGMLPLAIGSFLQVLSYSITGYVMPKEWYWLTEQIFVVLALVLILDALFSWPFRKWPKSKILVWGLVALYGLPLTFAYCQFTYLEMEHGYVEAGPPYLQAATYLEKFTVPGDVLGMTGGGNVAYFLPDRTVFNMDGLINSYAYFQSLQVGRGSDYLYQSGMRYVFANPGLLAASPYRGQYANRLQIIDDTWGGKFFMRFLPRPTP